MSAPAARRRALSTLPGSSSPASSSTLPVCCGGSGKKPEVLPAVNYKIDQWLNTCKQAWQADPAAFMAAVNADAKQRKLALEGSAVQPGLLADVPMQSVAWLVPQLLPLGEVSLLGADGGTGKGI